VCVVTFVILAYLENGRLERRESPQRILNYTGMKSKGSFWVISSSFWSADNWNNTSFWMVFQVQKLCDVSSRRL